MKKYFVLYHPKKFNAIDRGKWKYRQFASTVMAPTQIEAEAKARAVGRKRGYTVSLVKLWGPGDEAKYKKWPHTPDKAI